MLSLCAVAATQSRQYSTEQMKWFRKDKSYLWVRSELEKSNPIADALKRITHCYRADRSVFEAALCASQPGQFARFMHQFDSLMNLLSSFLLDWIVNHLHP